LSGGTTITIDGGKLGGGARARQLTGSVCPVREAAQVTTKRLRLAPVAVGYADELFVIISDPSDGQIRLAYSDRPLD
jgi:hypothetical protein